MFFDNVSITIKIGELGRKNIEMILNYIQELEEQNLFLLARGDIDSYHKLRENYIPKQKVQSEIDKLEELTKDKNKEFYYANYRYTKNILEKLLE